ncbi:MAG: hypothetical protein H8Z69_05035 [Nanohaloarchaea archaeon]|nr:hypothetical protein [Candidatus Nanohaloarchaea archaeon]
MKAVVDTNVIVHGRGSYAFDTALMVPEVLEEIKSSKGRNNLRNLKYEVRTPSEKILGKVRSKSDEINSPTSDEDEKLLALAVQTGHTLVTDDKPLQNLALHLEADFEGFLDLGTDEKYRWELNCSNCGRKVTGSRCSRCGSNPDRRRVRCNS